MLNFAHVRSRKDARSAGRSGLTVTEHDRQSAGRLRVSRLVKRLWSFVPPKSRAVLVVGVALNIVLGFTATFPALVVGKIVDTISAPHPPLLASELLVVLALLYAAQAVIRVYVHSSMHGLLPRFEAELRSELVRSTLRAPMSDTDTRYTAEINSQMSRGAEGSSRLLRLVFGDLIPAALRATWAISLAFLKSPIMGAVVLVAGPASFLISHLQLRSQGGVRVRIERAKARLEGMLTELVGGKAVIRTLDAVDSESERLSECAQAVSSTERDHHQAMGRFDIAKFGLESILAIAVVSIGVLLVDRGTLAPGGVMTLYLLVGQAVQPLHEIHRMRDDANESGVQAQRAIDLLDQPCDEFFLRTGVPGFNATNAIEVSGLSADYSGRAGERVPILHTVDLDVPAGSMIGVCGRTGSGKSTLVRCIAGLHARSTGTVRIFGTSLEELGADGLARTIAYASQTPYLIAGTVRENVAFGLKVPATDDEIVSALEAAAIWPGDEAMRSRVFPEGLDTVLGEGGMGLSGGEMQRLVLARLILRRPRVLILDEATSALDNITERAVMSNICTLGTTVLAIAHRLSTLRPAQAILVLEAGRVVEAGTYDELRRNNGAFAGLLSAAADSHVTADDEAVTLALAPAVQVA